MIQIKDRTKILTDNARLCITTEADWKLYFIAQLSIFPPIPQLLPSCYNSDDVQSLLYIQNNKLYDLFFLEISIESTKIIVCSRNKKFDFHTEEISQIS